MSYKRVMIPGRNLAVPKDLVPLVLGLEEIAGTNIAAKEFSERGSSKKEIELRGYDEQTKMISIRCKHTEYIQVFAVKVTEQSQVLRINELIKNYKF